MDKFLTDIAGFDGVDSVSVHWRSYFGDDERFEVVMGNCERGRDPMWELHYGTGSTVDVALAKARLSRAEGKCDE